MHEKEKFLQDRLHVYCHDKELGIASNPYKMLSVIGVTSGIERNYILLFKVQLSWVVSFPSKPQSTSGKG